MYARGQKEEFNDWNKIAGVKNWGWDGIKPYFSKCESFDKRIHPDDKDSKDYSHLEEHHNYDGPIKTSYASFRSSSERAYHEAAINNGFKVPVDAWSGVNHGIVSISTHLLLLFLLTGAFLTSIVNRAPICQPLTVAAPELEAMQSLDIWFPMANEQTSPS